MDIYYNKNVSMANIVIKLPKINILIGLPPLPCIVKENENGTHEGTYYRFYCLKNEPKLENNSISYATVPCEYKPHYKVKERMDDGSVPLVESKNVVEYWPEDVSLEKKMTVIENVDSIKLEITYKNICDKDVKIGHPLKNKHKGIDGAIVVILPEELGCGPLGGLEKPDSMHRLSNEPNISKNDLEKFKKTIGEVLVKVGGKQKYVKDLGVIDGKNEIWEDLGTGDIIIKKDGDFCLIRVLEPEHGQTLSNWFSIGDFNAGYLGNNILNIQHKGQDSFKTTDEKEIKGKLLKPGESIKLMYSIYKNTKPD